jgi:hypothetical protein
MRMKSCGLSSPNKKEGLKRNLIEAFRAVTIPSDPVRLLA